MFDENAERNNWNDQSSCQQKRINQEIKIAGIIILLMTESHSHCSRNDWKNWNG